MDSSSVGAVECAIDSLCADGQTNLWAGLHEGLKLLTDRCAPRSRGRTSRGQSYPNGTARGPPHASSLSSSLHLAGYLACPTRTRSGRNKAVFLLTDGCPNVEPPSGHLAALRAFLDEKGADCSISTFGFGYSLDSKLLHELASAGQGGYAFIPDGSFVGTVFVNATSNVLSTAARAVTLRVSGLPAAALASAEVPGFARDAVARPSWGLSLPLGPLRFGQPRAVVLSIPTAALGEPADAPAEAHAEAHADPIGLAALLGSLRVDVDFAPCGSGAEACDAEACDAKACDAKTSDAKACDAKACGRTGLGSGLGSWLAKQVALEAVGSGAEPAATETAAARALVGDGGGGAVDDEAEVHVQSLRLRTVDGLRVLLGGGLDGAASGGASAVAAPAGAVSAKGEGADSEGARLDRLVLAEGLRGRISACLGAAAAAAEAAGDERSLLQLRGLAADVDGQVAESIAKMDWFDKW